MTCKKTPACYSICVVRNFVSTRMPRLWCTTSGRMMIVLIDTLICDVLAFSLLRNHNALFTATLVVINVAGAISLITFLYQLSRAQMQ